ncbi:hypothetical protein HPB52_024923 [Rhipicephalus sanguineus]|uniref:Secreted protein n=1 Tax=Rhipicephalus sanguineus TaxID=34632 RepID=A0A9D4PAW1_RHISA|nr:hypothetical protein HPB52_024923 [Rhipicephalus sanguineus]
MARAYQPLLFAMQFLGLASFGLPELALGGPAGSTPLLGTVVPSHTPLGLRPAPSTCIPRHARLRAPCAHTIKSTPVNYHRLSSFHPAILARVPVPHRQRRRPFRQDRIYCLAIACAPLVGSAARQR